MTRLLREACPHCGLLALQSLIAKLPKRVIAPDCPEGKIGRPLMTRYFLFRTERLGIFLHHFHRSDLDELHDHPWTFITFLITSGYWEHLPTDKTWTLGTARECPHATDRVWRPRFSILYRPAEWQHFVEIPRPLWTVVIRFRKVREWGFIKHGVWIWWKKFEELKSRSICEEV